jgi:hypothetical protein
MRKTTRPRALLRALAALGLATAVLAGCADDPAAPASLSAHMDGQVTGYQSLNRH